MMVHWVSILSRSSGTIASRVATYATRLPVGVLAELICTTALLPSAPVAPL